MKIKALKNFIFNKKIARLDDELELEDSKANYLIEHGFAVSLDKPKVIAEQPKLDLPAFGTEPEKITNKVKSKAKTTKSIKKK